MRRALLALGAVLTLAGCTDSPPPPAASPSVRAAPSVSATPLADVPRPKPGACRRLSYAAAIAPTDSSSSVPCRRPHTTVTFAVGSLDAVVAGHLVAVDSTRVQEGLARSCPARLAAYVGGSAADRATSMLRAIWFSPTIDQFDAGEDWFRCDVTVLAAENRLVTLRGGSLKGALAQADWRERYGMCGTADPATRQFERVVCSAPHRWEAIGVGGSTDDCEGPARDVADDPLTVTWSYERPARAEKQGICWVPSG